MFTVSYFKPRETDYVQVYTKQVDITNWKYLKPVGFTVCAIVIAIYIYFAN